jgi:diguanylate cyclase (GGDEF)-like protein
MKVSSNRPVTNPYAVRRTGSTAHTSETSQRSGVSGAVPVEDTASVMGIPETEVTPKVRDAIMSLMAEVDRLRIDLAHARKRIDELENLADQDPLVPLYNRRAFLRELGRIMAFSERYEVQASLLYFDLNGFKDINDTHGHAAGDALLAHIAALMVSHVRESDVVARIGGDEFGVILARAPADAAAQKAKELADLVAATPLTWKGKALGVTLSFGVYSFQKGESADDVLANADRAMYERKKKAARPRKEI